MVALPVAANANVGKDPIVGMMICVGFRARIGLDSDCPQYLILPVGRAPGVLLHPPGLSLIMHVFYQVWAVCA